MMCGACHRALSFLLPQPAAGMAGSTENMSQASSGKHSDEQVVFDAPAVPAQGRRRRPGAQGGTGNGDDAGGARLQSVGRLLMDATVSTAEPSEENARKERGGEESGQGEENNHWESEAGRHGNKRVELSGACAPGSTGLLLLQ